MEPTRTIQLPQSLCEAVEEQFQGQFDTLDSFVILILQQLTEAQGLEFDEQEEKLLEQRLRDLGYV